MSLAVWLAATVWIGADAPVRIERKAADFVETEYLNAKTLAAVREKGYLRGAGAAAYAFDIPETGWYELWIRAGGWPTDLLLDGRLLMRTPLKSGVWPDQKKAVKVTNLHLARGAHRLKLSRLGHPGLPWMKDFHLLKTDDPANQVRLQVRTDCLVLRRGQHVPLRLQAGRSSAPRTLEIVVRTVAGQRVQAVPVAVPAGTGVFTKDVLVPCTQAGVFDVTVEQGGKKLDRVTQFAVIDPTARTADGAQELRTTLVAEIDCARQAPTYSGGGATRVIASPLGAYRESGPKGRCQHGQAASWFAYTLPVPEVQKPYVVELHYPDDDERTMTVSIFENAMCPYPLDAGVASGGEFPLSGRLQVQRLFFWPRQKDPRLVLLTWHSGQRAAAARIRLLRVDGGFPPLAVPAHAPSPTDRRFGFWNEEPLRFTTFFGGVAGHNEWPKFIETAGRWARWSRFVGANVWVQTAAIYQSKMWPSRLLPGYAHACEDHGGAPGPASLKDPCPKDLIRLLALTGEAHGVSVIPELHLNWNGTKYRWLDKRFGGKGTTDDDGPAKPWLIVSRDGKAGAQASYQPRYNPVHPAVQQWAADLLQELGARYKDSPAFAGVALRLMGWTFISWQCFPSINWGYGDYTLSLFEKDTGVKVPVGASDPNRYRKRFDWLTTHQPKRWVAWRCRKVHAYYRRLRDVLRAQRKDLVLYVHMCGPHYAPQDYVARAAQRRRDMLLKGWTGLARESGVDPGLFRAEPGIVLINHFGGYPAGRSAFGPGRAMKAAGLRDDALSPEMLRVTAGQTGVACACTNQYFEADLALPPMGLKRPFAGGPQPHLARICGVVNPPGRLFLQRYAFALANGNVTFMVDGGLGYYLGQPDLLREFMRQYRALPAVRFDPALGYADPVAIWQAKLAGRLVFYLVNREPYELSAQVKLDGLGTLKSLGTGRPVSAPGGKLNIVLPAYALRAFEAQGGTVAAITCTVPPKRRQALGRQIQQAETLLTEDATDGPLIVALSPQEFKAARRLVREARQAFDKGWVWKARRVLMDHRMEQVYRAFGRRPDGLWARRSPSRPAGALDAPKLKSLSLAPAGMTVAPSSQVQPTWTGEEVLQWRAPVGRFKLRVPYTGRYRVHVCAVTGGEFGALRLSVGAREVGRIGNGSQERSAHAVARTFRTPLVLSAGEHVLTIRREGGQLAALVFCHLELLWRDIVANRWRVVGPFPSKPRYRQVGDGFDTVYGPERRRDFGAVYVGRHGKKVRWQVPKLTGDYVDFAELYHVSTDGICYAVTTIESPEDRAAALSLGVDYWAKIWLSGRLVLNMNEHHLAPRKAERIIPIQLTRGRNELLVKVNSGSAGNGFWLAITDPGDYRIGP